MGGGGKIKVPSKKPHNVFSGTALSANFKQCRLSSKLGNVCLSCFYQSTTMVMLRQSINLTTLFLGKLPIKWLTSTKCPYFRQ